MPPIKTLNPDLNLRPGPQITKTLKPLSKPLCLKDFTDHNAAVAWLHQNKPQI
ncbi:hypothetical protein SynA1544_02479 [Synechococcus sp. A15-44]|nr:hypothetical protein SynA1544_02479 [Synechococcus sp. A15-44]